ncbi:MAG: ThuA domain-containing protein [Pirellulaceae bacterium]
MIHRFASLSILMVSLCLSNVWADQPKNVLLLGQKRDHPPGSHEYVPGLHLLAKALAGYPGMKLTVVAADEPWKEGPERLDKADAVVLYLGQGGRWAENDPAREAALAELAARGAGIVALHWAIGSKDARFVPGHRARIGAVHGGPDRKYIFTEKPYRVEVLPHAITTGIDDFELQDEYYYRLKRSEQGTVTPLLLVPIEGSAEMVAWAFERPDGGRSFGFSGMHFHDSWKQLECRRMIAQGLLWTLKMPIPSEGLPVDVPDEAYLLPAAE